VRIRAVTFHALDLNKLGHGSSYGRLLLAKIALFLIAIAIAGANRTWVDATVGAFG
jgi:putative copper export protein